MSRRTVELRRKIAQFRRAHGVEPTVDLFVPSRIVMGSGRRVRHVFDAKKQEWTVAGGLKNYDTPCSRPAGERVLDVLQRNRTGRKR